MAENPNPTKNSSPEKQAPQPASSTSDLVPQNVPQKVNASGAGSPLQKSPAVTASPQSPNGTSKRFRGAAVEVLKRAGYAIVSQIGSGAYAKVYKIKNEKNGREAAVKVINPSKQSHRYRTQMLPRELKVLMRVKHPNVISVEQIYTHPDGDFILIIMSYAPGGTMQAYIDKHGPYPEAKARSHFRGMAAGVHFMHKMDPPVAHRDLKLENILLDKKGEPLITDFSYTKYTETKDGNDLSTTFCGTEPFLAPEVLANTPYDPLPADVWSLGVCLFYMLNGKKPFNENADRMIYNQRHRKYSFVSSVASKISIECKDIISKMLEPFPNKRITMDQVVQHPWLHKK